MRILGAFALGLFLLGLSTLVAPPAHARKWCMAGHYHYGTGSAADEDDASDKAERSWASFVNFEYGGAWDDFGNAKNDRMRCARSGAGYSCTASGIPCRYKKRKRRRRRRG